MVGLSQGTIIRAILATRMLADLAAATVWPLWLQPTATIALVSV
jgi:hypothetical protein